MNSVPKTEWDDPREVTAVHDGAMWTARGILDGEEQGRVFGPQSYWRFVAYNNHPELNANHQRMYLEGLLRGVMQGIQARRDER